MTNYVMKRLVKDQLATAELEEILRSGPKSDSYFEEVKVNNTTITLAGFPKLTDAELPQVGTALHESKTAEALFTALNPAVEVLPNLLDEPRIWAWICSVPMSKYVLARWFPTAGSSGDPIPDEIKTAKFLTSRNSLEQHARNGARRLYIAARACNGADGDMRNLQLFFEYTDLFVGIFERRVGLDNEMAVELALALHTENEAKRRYVIRSINLMLGTISLEYISRAQKKRLILDAIADF